MSLHFVDRLTDRNGRVVDNCIVESGGKRCFSSAIFFRTASDVAVVEPGSWKMAPQSRFSAEPTVDRVIARSEFHLRNIAHARDHPFAPVLTTMAELFRPRVGRVNCILECGCAFGTGGAPIIPAATYVLFLQRLHDILCRQTARRGLVRIKPYRKIFARLRRHDVAHAIEAREFVANLKQCNCW